MSLQMGLRSKVLQLKSHPKNILAYFRIAGIIQFSFAQNSCSSMVTAGLLRFFKTVLSSVIIFIALIPTFKLLTILLTLVGIAFLEAAFQHDLGKKNEAA